jgi:hypothetical protein
MMTSEGAVALPILYFDASNVVAAFGVDRDLAARLLPKELEPVCVRDRAVVALSFYEYRSSSVGPYTEVGIGQKTRWSTAAAFVVDLPVTTRTANAAGREIWGYPKFVTPITFSLRGRRFSSSVIDPAGDEPIVTISGDMGMALPSPPVSFSTFTLRDQKLLRTTITVRGRCAIRGRGNVALRVGRGSQHRMAQNLRALDLDGARPIALITTQKFTARLPEGVES